MRPPGARSMIVRRLEYGVTFRTSFTRGLRSVALLVLPIMLLNYLVLGFPAASIATLALFVVAILAFLTWHFRYVVTPDGVSGYDMLFRPRTLSWSEIETAGALSFPPFRWLEVRGSGISFVVPSIIRTPGAFLEALLGQVPDGNPIIAPAKEIFGGRRAAS